VFAVAANLLITAPSPATADSALATPSRFSTINTLMEPASERLAELAVALHQRGLRGAACRFAARNESYTLGSNIAYVKAAVVTTIENTLADGIWRERLTTELCGTMGNWL